MVKVAWTLLDITAWYREGQIPDVFIFVVEQSFEPIADAFEQNC